MVARSPEEKAKYFADNPDKLLKKLEREAKKAEKEKTKTNDKPEKTTKSKKAKPAKKSTYSKKKPTTVDALALLNPWVHKYPPRSNTSEGNYSCLNLMTNITRTHTSVNGDLYLLIAPNIASGQHVFFASPQGGTNWLNPTELPSLNTAANLPEEARVSRAGIRIANYTKSDNVAGIVKVLVLTSPLTLEWANPSDGNYTLTAATFASWDAIMDSSPNVVQYPGHKFIDNQEIICPKSSYIHYNEYKEWTYTVDVPTRKQTIIDGLKKMGLANILIKFEPPQTDNPQSYTLQYRCQLLARYDQNNILSTFAKPPLRFSSAEAEAQQQVADDQAHRSSQQQPVRRQFMGGFG